MEKKKKNLLLDIIIRKHLGSRVWNDGALPWCSLGVKHWFQKRVIILDEYETVTIRPTTNRCWCWAKNQAILWKAHGRVVSIYTIEA